VGRKKNKKPPERRGRVDEGARLKKGLPPKERKITGLNHRDRGQNVKLRGSGKKQMPTRGKSAGSGSHQRMGRYCGATSKREQGRT